MRMQVRPLESWPRPYTKNRRRAQFRAGYSDTLALLETELAKIGAQRPFLEMALRPDEIRLDGFPRVGASPSHPGVILWFERKGQTVSMPCDAFDHWEDNLRAIAKSLEALRAVDRYGVTTSGEQYAGWTRLAAGDNRRFETKEAASAFLDRLMGHSMGERNKFPRDAYRRAVEKRTHPDAGGSEAEFKAAQEAMELLGF